VFPVLKAMVREAFPILKDDGRPGLFHPEQFPGFKRMTTVSLQHRMESLSRGMAL